MPSKVTFECPGCLAKLSAPDKSKLGKKIKCPKCQEVFAPEIADDDDFAMDDLPEDEPVEESPRRKGAGGGNGKRNVGKKGGKGGSSGDGSNTPLIIGGIVGVVVLIGVGLLLAGVFGRKAEAPVVPVIVDETPAPAAAPPVAKAPEAPPASVADRVFGLRWMPAATDLIIHVKLADLWNAPLLKGATSNPIITKQIEETKKKFGVGPADVESITVGIVDAYASAVTLTASETPQTPPGVELTTSRPSPAPKPMRNVLVLKTKKPVDIKQVAATENDVKIEEKYGKSYLMKAADPTRPGSVPEGFWTPNPNTVIVATEAEFFATLERGETVVPRKELSAMNSDSMIVIATVFPDMADDGKWSMFEFVPGFAQARNSMKPFGMKTGSVGLNVKGGFDLRLTTSSGTAEGAQNLKSEIEKNLASVKEMFNAYKQTAPPVIAELGEIVLANARIVEQSQVVKLTTSVPDSAQAKLEQLPPFLMMMAMTSGMSVPGFGAPPGMPANSQGIMSPGKQPGETAGVEPQKAEGLLDGMKMEARTAWSAQPTISPEGTPIVTLDLLIDVTGTGLETICGSAGITPTTMKLADGGTLHATTPHKPVAGDVVPETAFGLFDAADVQTTDHPPQTLRVRLAVDPPTSTAKSLAVFEGSFKYLTSSGSEPITIENAVRTASRPLTQAALKAAGVNLRRSHSTVRPQSLTLWCDKHHFLGQVRGTPGDLIAFTELEKEHTVQRLYSNHPGQTFPDELQLQFSLFSNVEEKMVRFRFENVPLPAPETKPAMGAATPGGAPQLGIPGVPPGQVPPGQAQPGVKRELPPGARPDPPGTKRDQNGRVIDD